MNTTDRRMEIINILIVRRRTTANELAEEFGFESWEEMSDAVGEEAMNNYILPDKVLTFLADNAVEK